MVRFLRKLDDERVAMRLASCIWIGFGVVSATLCQSINSPAQEASSGRCVRQSNAIGRESRAGGDRCKRKLDGQQRVDSQVAGDLTIENDLSTTSNHNSSSAQTPLSSDADSSLPSLSGSSSSSSNDPLSSSTSGADVDNSTDSSGVSSSNLPASTAGPSSSPLPATTIQSALPTVALGYPPIPTASNPDQGGLNSTLSNTSSTQIPPSSGSSSSRTKSIAVGVAVPMIVIAVGLIAFWVLVRKRRRGYEKDAEKAAHRNVEGSETPGAETRENTETTEAELVFGSLEQDVKPTDRVSGAKDRGGSDEGSHASRSTVRFRVDEARAADLPSERVSPSSAQVGLPQGEGKGTLAADTPNLTRVRSKRKPVPKLVESTADALETDSDVKR